MRMREFIEALEKAENISEGTDIEDWKIQKAWDSVQEGIKMLESRIKYFEKTYNEEFPHLKSEENQLGWQHAITVLYDMLENLAKENSGA